MKRFPSLQALAGSDEQDVLNAWEGLGYYSRARSLLKAARQLNDAGSTSLPATRAELRSCPASAVIPPRPSLHRLRAGRGRAGRQRQARAQPLLQH
jgi:hypothetical protein